MSCSRELVTGVGVLIVPRGCPHKCLLPGPALSRPHGLARVLQCATLPPPGSGRFHFSHPSTQQHLLVWRERPKVVMVIKKLGRELTDEFLQVRERVCCLVSLLPHVLLR
jgi:hypothetical protein